MNRLLRHRRALRAVAPAIVAVMLAGCGAGISDSDQIASIVKDEGTDPATLCGHVTDAVLVRFGGKRACQRAAGSAAKDPTTHATNVKVHGTAATAVVSDRSGTRTITFVKRSGVWKVSGTQ